MNLLDQASNWEYVALEGKHILITAASVEQTGLVAGAFYEFTAFGGSALCRWDTSAATIADNGFTFCVQPGVRLIVQNPIGNTLLNVIEASADSGGGAALTLCRVLPR